jgi:Pectate lyase superfamily protein
LTRALLLPQVAPAEAQGPGLFLSQAVGQSLDLEGIANVRKFGAVGDGAKDDTVAMQAAIDAIEAKGGGVVFLPVGKYLISSSLSLGSRTLLLGVAQGFDAGSQLRLARASNASMVTNKPGAVGRYGVIGIAFQGDRLGQARGSGIEFTRNDFVVTDCFFNQIKDSAVHLRGAGAGWVLRNFTQNIGGAALRLTSAPDNVIAHNQITTSVGGSHGLLLERSADHNIVTENFVFTSRRGISIESGSQSNIIGFNRINDNRAEGIMDAGSRNLLIGNICKNSGTEGHGPRAGVQLQGSHGIVLGNACFDDQRHKTQAYGIRVETGREPYVVIGNSVGGNASGGISVAATAATVLGNSGHDLIRKQTAGTASVDFPAVAGNSCALAMAQVIGVDRGDSVTLGLSEPAVASNSVVFTGFVSDRDVVTIKACNVAPAAWQGTKGTTVHVLAWRE